MYDTSTSVPPRLATAFMPKSSNEEPVSPFRRPLHTKSANAAIFGPEMRRMPPSQIRASSNVRPSNGVGAAIVVVVEVVVVDEVVDSIVDGSVTT